MKNTRKLKQILVTSTLVLGILAISGTTSKAALQANAAHMLQEKQPQEQVGYKVSEKWKKVDRQWD